MSNNEKTASLTNQEWSKYNCQTSIKEIINQLNISNNRQFTNWLNSNFDDLISLLKLNIFPFI